MSTLPRSTRLKRMIADDNGNVLMIMALSMIPVLSVVGASVDYGRAASAENQMNAYADAAALTGVTKTEMQSTANPVGSYTGTLQAYNDVINQFNAQASHVKGANYNSENVVVTVSDDNGTNTATYTTVDGGPSLTVTKDGTASNKTSLTRNVTVTYNASVTNDFMGIIGNNTTNIGGTSASSASVAPNIDFYVMMDTSPSMLFPTNDADITTLSNQTGCAYACHQSNAPTSDNTTTYKNSSGQTVTTDFYGFAVSKGLTLRFNAEQTAVSQLMSTAYTIGGQNQAAYRMVVNQFDVGMANLQTQITITDGTASYSQTNANTAAANSLKAKLYVPAKNNLDSNGNNNNDQDTHFEDTLTALNSSSSTYYIPNPGKGTNLQGDSPQKILFIVTDGYDENSRFNQPGFGPLDTTKCDAIKNRGIRIAILYTKIDTNSYVDSWSKANALPQVPALESALANCASANLLYTVSNGGDITAALTSLFKQAVASAKLTY